VHTHDASATSIDFYREIAKDHLSALWTNLAALAPGKPAETTVPHLWSGRHLRERVMEAGGVISSEDAERRVLVLENPTLKGRFAITPSLYAGIQLLLPGESARSHRHSASALRLVLTGEGGYTSVDGIRVGMSPGDFIITPSWTFHDHGNDGTGPVTWLDGLDLHIINLLGAAFGEPYPDAHQPAVAHPTGPLARDPGLLHAVSPQGHATKRIHWPYVEARAELVRLQSCQPADAAVGYKLTYVDPVNRQSPFPTMEAFLQLLPKGFNGTAHRVTDGTVYCVVEGSGEATIGSKTFQFGRHDVFVAPTWAWQCFRCNAEVVLFSYSDRILQRNLGIWREERASASPSA
jgi:gentisate 1,2-dioxygenase